MGLSKIFPLFLGAFLCAATTVSALPYGYYVGVDAGANLSKVGRTMDFHDSEFPQIFDRYQANRNLTIRPTFGVHFGAGMPFQKRFLATVGLGIYQNLSREVKGQILGQAKQDQHYADYSYKISALRVMAEGRCYWTVFQRFSPFAELGLGYGHVRADGYNVHYLEPNPPVDYSSFTKKAVGNCVWQIGGGVNYQINHMLGLILGYRFVSLGDVRMRNNNADVMKTGSLYNNEIYVGIQIVN